MNKLTIPAILAATVLVAGMFAFMPVEQASTVHTIIQASTTQISVQTSQKTAGTGEDFTITCPTTSAGCRILEVYLDDDDADADDADADVINVVRDGENVQLAADVDNAAVDNITVLLNGLSGVAMAAGDTITIPITGDSSDYTLTVIAETEGDSEIGLT